MLHKFLAVLAGAAIMVSAIVAEPSHAQPAKRKHERRPADAGSLDGRVLGYPRTCGHDMLLYGPGGEPRGPYCH
jgi:hypothetical protein